MGTQHVVIVDDNDLSLKLLSGLALEVPSAVPHPFQSSQDALAWCTGQSVDCFVLDYHMPAPDGLEMVRLLRKVPAFELVPIVIVTGEGERDVRYKAFAAGANDFIQKPVDRREFVARISTQLSLQAARGQLAMHVDQLEASLRDEGQRASDHAHRLEALWRMSNNATLDDEELLHAMLEQGAAALRPGMSFCGMLSRLDGSEIIVEAAFNPLDVDAPGGLHAGDRTPLEDSASIEVIRSGISRYWDDVLTDPAFARRKRVQQLRWRSLISTPFRAGGASYFLTFSAQQPTTKPFGKEDLAYVELLGAFFGTHLQQRWQWSRIRYQSEHDALTGLRNRGQFRSEGRLALAASLGGAVAIANVDDFRQVNETFGTVIGDALLVEVGAALAQRATEGEIVARLDGDAFGIFLPDASRTTVGRRVAEFATAFEAGFSTGDREGKETIGLTATIGVALAPDDARTFDELLARADAAVSAAKESHRGRTTFFAPGMEGRAERRLRLVNEIVEALAREEFELNFQPHIDLTTMSVSGAEALIRWNHPTRGLLLPDEFIPFAEQWGVGKTASNSTAWHRRGPPSLPEGAPWPPGRSWPSRATSKAETLAHQRAWAQQCAKERGWRLTRVVEGVATGKAGPRKIVHELLADLRAIDADARPKFVLMIRLDRLGRGDVIESQIVLRDLRELGVGVWTRDSGEERIDSAMQQLISAAKSAVAAHENEVRADKSRAVYARKRAAGLPIGARRPYGLLLGADGRDEVDPERADVVREAFRMRAAGSGYHLIGKRLAEIAPVHLFKNGRTITVRWTSTRVIRMLENRAYVDGGIINEVAFLRVAKVREGVGAVRAQPRYAWPLSGAISCYCHRAMNGIATGSEPRRNKYYACKAIWNHGGHHRLVRAADLEAQFVALLGRLHASPESAARYRRKAAAPGGSVKTLGSALRALRVDLEQVRRSREKVWEMHAAGRIRDEDVQERLDVLAGKRDEINDRIAGAQEHLALANAATKVDRDANALIARASRTYARGTDADRRAITRAVALDLGGLCVEENGRLTVRRVEDPGRQRKRRAGEA